MLCAGCTGKDAEGSSAGGSGEQTATADSRQNEAGSNTEAAPKTETAATASRSWSNMSLVSSMDLLYADQFSVDYYENDISLITIGDTDQFLLLPEGMSAPVGLPDSIKILQKPVKNIYLVATSAMDDFIHLDAMDLILRHKGHRMVSAGSKNGNGRGKNCLCRKVQRSGLREDLKQ